MEERKKHKVMIGIEVILLGMIIAIIGTNAASSNPPSNGVSYSKNNQTTVEGALNDLYNKANYGNASAGQILSGKTALVGGSKVTGTMPDRGLAQYGSWGCGDAGCGSGEDAYYSINALPEGYYHSDGNWWAPEARINANTLRSSLGITASKILKGQSIAGVAGTGETTCSTCESQGYWKVYKFENLNATCSRKTGTCNNTSWFSASTVTTKNCGKDCLEYTSDNDTYLMADIDIDYKEILKIGVSVVCSGGPCIRISAQKSEEGGADKTISAKYFRVGYRFGLSVGEYFTIAGTADDTSYHGISANVDTSKIKVSFISGTDLVGKKISPIELKGTSYMLSGYIVYR